MSKVEIKNGFIKKYWFYLLILSVVLIFAGISIDVWYSNGNVKPIQISIFNDKGIAEVVNTYKFEYEHSFLKVFSIVLYSFSMSLLISLFILKVIQKDDDKERELKDERRKEAIFKNVFKGVFNRLVPNEIFDVIKSDILEAKVVRKNVQWIYDFKIENEQLVLYRNVMYEIHNISSEPCNEPFSYIYSSTEYTETKILFLKWHEKNDIKSTFIAYDVERDGEQNHRNIEEIESNNSTNNILQLENKDIDFEQVKHDVHVIPGTVIKINFKSKETFKNNSNFVHETHFTTACSIGWELEVNYPIGYSFSILPMFSANLIPTVDDVDRKKYSHEGAILKGQGIEFTITKVSK